VNIAIHFIRARSSLILCCSSERIPYIYSLFSGKGEEKRDWVEEKVREGRVVRTVIVVINFDY